MGITMKSKITDMLPVIASDQRTLAVEVLKYLKRGWHTRGAMKTMRPLNDLSTLVYVQWVVLSDEPNVAFNHVSFHSVA